MANMSYCRWENTLSDLHDCDCALDNMEYKDGKWFTIHEGYSVDEEDREEELNEYEQRALKTFAETCERVAADIRRKMG